MDKLAKTEIIITLALIAPLYMLFIEHDELFLLFLIEMSFLAAIRYDKDCVQTSPSDDIIMNAALRATELSNKIKLIEDTITLCAEGMESYLKLGVCYGLTFGQLESRGIPCGHKKYYEIRRRFLYELSKKI